MVNGKLGLRREHPHLPLIITEDALSPNSW